MPGGAAEAEEVGNIAQAAFYGHQPLVMPSGDGGGDGGGIADPVSGASVAAAAADAPGGFCDGASLVKDDSEEIDSNGSKPIDLASLLLQLKG